MLSASAETPTTSRSPSSAARWSTRTWPTWKHVEGAEGDDGPIAQRSSPRAGGRGRARRARRQRGYPVPRRSATSPPPDSAARHRGVGVEGRLAPRPLPSLDAGRPSLTAAASAAASRGAEHDARRPRARCRWRRRVAPAAWASRTMTESPSQPWGAGTCRRGTGRPTPRRRWSRRPRSATAPPSPRRRSASTSGDVVAVGEDVSVASRPALTHATDRVDAELGVVVRQTGVRREGERVRGCRSYGLGTGRRGRVEGRHDA